VNGSPTPSTINRGLVGPRPVYGPIAMAIYNEPRRCLARAVPRGARGDMAWGYRQLTSEHVSSLRVSEPKLGSECFGATIERVLRASAKGSI
jgi:hypothetical protein